MDNYEKSMAYDRSDASTAIYRNPRLKYSSVPKRGGGSGLIKSGGGRRCLGTFSGIYN